MWKRICVIILLVSVVLLTACGNEAGNKEDELGINEYDNTTLEGIIEGVEKDFDTTIVYLEKNLNDVYQTMNQTYEGYLENKQSLYDWYDLMKLESNALFKRTEEKAIEYYKLIASTIDHEKEGTMSDAMEDFYETVFEKCYAKYYEEVCDDMMDFVYGEIYEEIVEEAEDTIDETEWEKEYEECYEHLESTYEEISNLCYEVVNLQGEIWYAIGNEFYDKNFDVEKIVETCIANYEKEQQEEQQEEQESEPSDEFVDMMDAYEEFFDEYVDFINEYNSAEDITDMLTEYTQIMERYTNVMKELNELDVTELSTADALYYSEVMIRISEKMLEIEY